MKGLVVDENNTNPVNVDAGSVPSAPGVPAAEVPESIFRDEATLPQESPELQALADERARLKAERDRALAVGADQATAVIPQSVPAANNFGIPQAPQSVPTAPAPVAVVTPPLPSPKDKSLGRKANDGWLPSIGLFVARLVTATILGIHGMSAVTHLADTEAFLAKTVLPAPEIMAWVVGISELAIAIALVFGLLTRLAGIGVVAIGLGADLLYYWGPWSIFAEGQVGFLGDHELLIAAMGLVFVTVGGGGWSLDRSFRVGRAKDKAEQALARAGL